MVVLSSNITLGSVQIPWVNNVEIESSWESLTDKASVVLPFNLKVKGNQLLESIKVGDQVNIELGYDNALKSIFKGFISGLNPKIPIEIECEDPMRNLKQERIVASGRNASLQDVIDSHFKGYKTNVLDVELGNYSFNDTKAKFLEKLKSDFGLYSFFRNGVLTIGKPYDPSTANDVSFRINYDIIQEDLVYRRKEDLKLKVKAISNNPNGIKTELELGDSEGEQRTLNFYNLSAAELKAAAERELNRLKYDGWRGSITVFGEPHVKHGDIVELIHNGDQDKSGKYWVDKVKYSFGLEGYRQEIKLGARA